MPTINVNFTVIVGLLHLLPVPGSVHTTETGRTENSQTSENQSGIEHTDKVLTLGLNSMSRSL